MITLHGLQTCEMKNKIIKLLVDLLKKKGSKAIEIMPTRKKIKSCALGDIKVLIWLDTCHLHNGLKNVGIWEFMV